MSSAGDQSVSVLAVISVGSLILGIPVSIQFWRRRRLDFIKSRHPGLVLAVVIGGAGQLLWRVLPALHVSVGCWSNMLISISAALIYTGITTRIVIVFFKHQMAKEAGSLLPTMNPAAAAAVVKATGAVSVSNLNEQGGGGQYLRRRSWLRRRFILSWMIGMTLVTGVGLGLLSLTPSEDPLILECPMHPMQSMFFLFRGIITLIINAFCAFSIGGTKDAFWLRWEVIVIVLAQIVVLAFSAMGMLFKMVDLTGDDATMLVGLFMYLVFLICTMALPLGVGEMNMAMYRNRSYKNPNSAVSNSFFSRRGRSNNRVAPSPNSRGSAGCSSHFTSDTADSDGEAEADPWEVFDSLKDQLESKTGIRAFHQYLKQEFCVESILFWMDCRAFMEKLRMSIKLADAPKKARDMMEVSDQDISKEYADICEMYIQPNSMLEVNISYRRRASMLKELRTPSNVEEWKKWKNRVYREMRHAKKDVYILMRTPFFRFRLICLKKQKEDKELDGI